jgi:hypothetical protein
MHMAKKKNRSNGMEHASGKTRRAKKRKITPGLRPKLNVGIRKPLGVEPISNNCLPQDDAIDLVCGCGKPETDGVPLSSKLGQLFTDSRREQFCQCVANGVPISRSKIPCSPTNTLQDVVDAISC